MLSFDMGASCAEAGADEHPPAGDRALHSWDAAVPMDGAAVDAAFLAAIDRAIAAALRARGELH